jgi:hypothetical protein
MLNSAQDYSRYVYSLQERHPQIQQLRLSLYTTGTTDGILKGEIHFHGEIILHVVEVIDFAGGVLETYSYTVKRGQKALYWYDPQPHREVPSLAGTFPHHKHVPPQIKHNRIPSPGLSFEHPNLDFLVAEIERELLTGEQSA